MKRLTNTLETRFNGQLLAFCTDAGPCGCTLYGEIIRSSHHCQVVAPGLIPRTPGERLKTDHREAMQDLVRAREDVKGAQRQARQHLLRHDRVCRDGARNWTQRHMRWLEAQRCEHPVLQVVFQEHVDRVMEATQRVARLTKRIAAAMRDCSLRPVVEAAWRCRFPAGKTAHLRRKVPHDLHVAVQDIWSRPPNLVEMAEFQDRLISGLA